MVHIGFFYKGDKSQEEHSLISISLHTGFFDLDVFHSTCLVPLGSSRVSFIDHTSWFKHLFGDKMVELDILMRGVKYVSSRSMPYILQGIQFSMF